MARTKEEKNAYLREWRKKNRAKHNQQNKDNHKKLKIEVINRYGGVCACCGESVIDFLCIDHINNDGNKHRKEIGGRSGTRFYAWLRRNNYPVGFQVLCHNCNFSKHINKGKCIHQTLKDD